MEKIDTPIAISMAILAGLLAVVSLFAGKASGDMITHQAKANNLQAKANMARTKATDMWSYFQAKTLRKHMYRVSGDMLHALNTKPSIQKEWIKISTRYATEAAELKQRATNLDSKADRLQKEASVALDLSIKENKKADTLDLSRLCSEIGLVLCSIALVSKRRSLWLIGLLFGLASCSVFAFAMHLL